MTDSAARILIIDDEVDFSESLEVALQVLGYRPRRVGSLAQAAALLAQVPVEFELLLLDRNLPDGEGSEWLKSIRRVHAHLPVILLTAKGEVRDRVEGLEAGADDYLPKPFSIDELSARIRAILRRSRSMPGQTEGGAQSLLWQIDAERYRILGPQGWIKLTRLEFRLASQLIQNAGKILSREKLLTEVWGFSGSLHTRTVDYFMSRIRRKFGDSSEAPQYFLTHRGQGFEFRAKGATQPSTS